MGNSYQQIKFSRVNAIQFKIFPPLLACPKVNQTTPQTTPIFLPSCHQLPPFSYPSKLPLLCCKKKQKPLPSKLQQPLIFSHSHPVFKLPFSASTSTSCCCPDRARGRRGSLLLLLLSLLLPLLLLLGCSDQGESFLFFSFHQPQNHPKLTKNPRTPALLIFGRCFAAAVTGLTKRKQSARGAD